MESQPKIDVLLVEDSPTQSLAIRVALEKTGHKVHQASTGEEGLLMLSEHLPDIVLTDLNMPGISGLELLKIVRKKLPGVPVVLMTGDGDESVAAAALKNGAASYIDKDRSIGALLETIDRIVGASMSAHSFGYLLDSIQRCQYSFSLTNDRALVVSLVQYVQHLASRAAAIDREQRRNLGVAVEEALLNALYHGSLEVPEAFREMEPEARAAFVEQRCRTAPYQDRRIQVEAIITPDAVDLVIRDEGPGFDFRQRFEGLGKDPANLIVRRGVRGLVLMNLFMDLVEYRGAGSEVHLVKQLPPAR